MSKTIKRSGTYCSVFQFRIFFISLGILTLRIIMKIKNQQNSILFNPLENEVYVKESEDDNGR